MCLAIPIIDEDAREEQLVEHPPDFRCGVTVGAVAIFGQFERALEGAADVFELQLRGAQVGFGVA